MARPSDEPQPTPMPTDYIIYVPLAEYKAAAETGQTISYSSITSSNFTTYCGIPCLDTNTSTSRTLIVTENAINQGPSKPRSVSIWMVTTSSSEQVYNTLGSFNANKCIYTPYVNNYKIGGAGHSVPFPTTATVRSGEWNHVVQNYYEDGTMQMYVNGVEVGTVSGYTIDVNSTSFVIGGLPNNSSYHSHGYIAGVRVFNRTLTQSEVQALATEFTPHYAVTANDLSFSLYQKNESYSISYSSVYPVTFEIIEGTLPSSITFNTSTGTFTGKGLTDADHTYSLKVRLTASDSTPAECNVTISTYKTARISLSNQTFSFISNKAESKSMTYTSDEAVTFTVESGTLPAGMTLSSNAFSSNGQNTSAETKAVVIRATSPNNTTGVTATMTLTMQMNAIVCNAQTFKFYTEQGAKSKAVAYSGSLNAVTDVVFSMTGTLPAGVTFDNTTGTFTSDGTQSADETASVSVTVSSSSGTSTAATATITLEVHEGAPAVPDDYVFYMPLTSTSATAETGQSLTYNGTPTATTVDGIDCLQFNGASYLYTTDTTGLSTGSFPFTMSVWVRNTSTSTSTSRKAFFVGKASLNKGISLGVSNTRTWMYGGYLPDIKVGTFDTDTWHHMLETYDGAQYKCYLDGVLINTTSYSNLNAAYGGIYVGCLQDLGEKWIGYIAAARFYNRVITDAEITALSQEFTPTT